MTGRKMPAPGHALLNIADEYDIWFVVNTPALNRL